MSRGRRTIFLFTRIVQHATTHVFHRHHSLILTHGCPSYMRPRCHARNHRRCLRNHTGVHLPCCVLPQTSQTWGPTHDSVVYSTKATCATLRRVRVGCDVYFAIDRIEQVVEYGRRAEDVCIGYNGRIYVARTRIDFVVCIISYKNGHYHVTKNRRIEYQLRHLLPQIQNRGTLSISQC